jgi:ribosome-associated toxin RatA of RatAB toxin-antitoxin module
MKTARYFACLFSLFACLPAAFAQTAINVRQNGSLLSVEGWLDTQASRKVAWSVLTDYARFPEFVPGIRSNRVLEEAGRVTTVAQSGEIVAGVFRLQYEGTMKIEEHPGDSLQILFLTGPFKDVSGEWRLESAEKNRDLRLVYRLNMDMMHSPFPPPLAPGIAEQQVRTWVDVFGREMDKRMERRKAK